MKKKFEVGKCYIITFYDHAVGMRDKMICQVCGWVTSVDKDQVLISHWIITNDLDKDVINDNLEHTSIIRSTIIKTRKL